MRNYNSSIIMDLAVSIIFTLFGMIKVVDSSIKSQLNKTKDDIQYLLAKKKAKAQSDWIETGCEQ